MLLLDLDACMLAGSTSPTLQHAAVASLPGSAARAYRTVRVRTPDLKTCCLLPCSAVPDVLRHCTALESIDLSSQGGALYQQPRRPSHLPSLQGLIRMLYSPKRDLPAWLLDLPCLVTFKVGGRQVASAPQAACQQHAGRCAGDEALGCQHVLAAVYTG